MTNYLLITTGRGMEAIMAGLVPKRRTREELERAKMPPLLEKHTEYLPVVGREEKERDIEGGCQQRSWRAQGQRPFAS